MNTHDLRQPDDRDFVDSYASGNTNELPPCRWCKRVPWLHIHEQYLTQNIPDPNNPHVVSCKCIRLEAGSKEDAAHRWRVSNVEWPFKYRYGGREAVGYCVERWVKDDAGLNSVQTISDSGWQYLEIQMYDTLAESLAAFEQNDPTGYAMALEQWAKEKNDA